MKHNLEIKQSKNGMGVFAKVDIKANMPVLEFTGTIIPKDKLNVPPSQYLQVGSENYIGPSGAIDDLVNHSCEPNCFVHIVGNRAILYSLYVIKKGTELTFDYSTSSTDTLDSWKMDCQCGSYKCRKIISGYQYLPESIKETYLKKDMVPLFITRPNFYQKKW